MTVSMMDLEFHMLTTVADWKLPRMAPMFGVMPLVSPLHCDGSARPGAAQIDGAATTVARRKKERKYLELMESHARARLVVLAGEVEVIGLRRRRSSSDFWPVRRPDRNRASSEWNMHGDCVGPPSLHAQLGRSLLLF